MNKIIRAVLNNKIFKIFIEIERSSLEILLPYNISKARFRVTWIIIGVIAFILWPRMITVMIIHKNNKYEQYITATNAINNINFDGLKHDELILSNGTHMKIETPTKYPDDRIVYYQDIVLSVENDNGLAKVVTAFDKHGEEISMPF